MHYHREIRRKEVNPITDVLTSKTLGGLPIMPVVDRDPFINILIYGDPGVGKTVLAGSAVEVPDLSPLLYIDVEGGTLSLRERHPQVEVLRVQSFSQLGAVFNELRKGDTGYKTVVLDSITEIQKFGMYDIMRRALENDPDRDPDLPGIGEWGKNTEQIRRFVRAFRDLPMNTIFIGLAATDTDKKGRKSTRPSLSAKLSNEIAGFLDIVVYMYLKEVDGETRRVILSQGQEDFIAKDRTDRLPPILEEPNMQIIYSILFDERTN